VTDTILRKRLRLFRFVVTLIRLYYVQYQLQVCLNVVIDLHLAYCLNLETLTQNLLTKDVFKMNLYHTYKSASDANRSCFYLRVFQPLVFHGTLSGKIGLLYIEI